MTTQLTPVTLPVQFSPVEQLRVDSLPVHVLIARQAQRTPQAIALEFQEHKLTYTNLDRRANRLAQHLQRCGVGPNVLVGVCLEQSPQLIVTLLAILKAGGAYVPLDPRYPLERLALILEDAELPVLVTVMPLLEQLPFCEAKALCLDATEDAAAIAKAPAVPPLVRSRPEDLAYMIHTSGSTGKLKGIQISHRGLTNLLLSMAERPGLRSGERALALTSRSLDMSVPELFLPLVVGATMVLIEPSVVIGGSPASSGPIRSTQS